MSAWVNGDVVTFTSPDGQKQVAIRRDYGWKGGEWQVAIHGFKRVSDAFVTEHGTRLVPAPVDEDGFGWTGRPVA